MDVLRDVIAFRESDKERTSIELNSAEVFTNVTSNI